MRAGRLDEALREAEKARQLDPVSLPAVLFVGWVHYYRRDFDKAIDVAREVIELNPSYPHGYQLLALSYTEKGRKNEALKASDTAVSLTSDEAVALRYRGLVLSTLPDMGSEARTTAARMENLSEDRQAGYLAIIYGGVGDREKMYQWIDRAVMQRDSSVLLVNIEPSLAKYRQEHHFREILGRLGYLN